MTMILRSTPLALWHDIIHEAELCCKITLQEELEAYLVFLLMRYISKPEVVEEIVATQFMEGMTATLSRRQLILQAVGDQCLLFSGLFPHFAEKRHVKISYFVNMGRSSYAAISQASNDLYALLARYFVSLMDVLQALQQHPQGSRNLLPIQAYDLWNETGSQYALHTLKFYTQSELANIVGVNHEPIPPRKK